MLKFSKLNSLSILLTSSFIAASSAFASSAPITRDAIVSAAPIGTAFSATEAALLTSGYMSDGAISTTAAADPTRVDFEKITALAPYKAAPRVSFADVKPLIDSKCVMCHGAANPAAGLNLSTFSSVKSNLAKIQDRALVARTMPPMGPLAASESTLLANFIAAGALETIPANFAVAGSTVSVQISGSREVSTSANPVLSLDSMTVTRGQ